MENHSNKRRRTDNFEDFSNGRKHCKIQLDGIKLSAFEEFCSRFPERIGEIMSLVDDETLIRSKMASHKIAQLLDKERFFWIRIIITYNGNFIQFNSLWGKVVKKAPKVLSYVLSECCREEV